MKNFNIRFYDLKRNTEELSQEFLSTGKVLILAGPKNKFTELEMNSIRTFINSGGNVLVMLGEGGEKKSNTNINFLLEEFGIMINNGKFACLRNTIPSFAKFFQYSRLRCEDELSSNFASERMHSHQGPLE